MVQAEVVQPAMRQPTAHERRLREATHLPCRQVHKHQEEDQRARPTVQVDFGHARGEVLIAVDYWAKTRTAEVMSKRVPM